MESIPVCNRHVTLRNSERSCMHVALQLFVRPALFFYVVSHLEQNLTASLRPHFHEQTDFTCRSLRSCLPCVCYCVVKASPSQLSPSRLVQGENFPIQAECSYEVLKPCWKRCAHPLKQLLETQRFLLGGAFLCNESCCRVRAYIWQHRRDQAARCRCVVWLGLTSGCALLLMALADK